MIRKLEVIDARYCGLEAKLPAGLELDTGSSILLLVGPNGVGKTALMRMIASSIKGKLFFDEHGFSRRLYLEDSLGRDRYAVMPEAKGKQKVFSLIEHLRTAQDRCEIDDDDMGVIAAMQRDHSLRLGENPFVEERTATAVFSEWRKQASRSGYDPDEVLCMIKDLKRANGLISGDLTRLLTHYSGWEKHVMTAIKTHPAGKSVYDQRDDLLGLIGQMNSPLWREHEVRTYLSDGAKAALLSYIGQFSAKTPENTWRYLSADMSDERLTFFEYRLPSDPNDGNAFDDAPYSHFREDDRRVGRSPGSALKDDIEELLGRVHLLLEKGQVYRPKSFQETLKDPSGTLSDPFKIVQCGEPHEQQALVLMDEPTTYLDYRNTLFFRNGLLAAKKAFGDRVQFIIPTNDAFLIEGLQGECRYIDMYSTPAVSLDDFRKILLED